MMRAVRKLAIAGAVAGVGLGLGTAAASAYSISGGSYTSIRSGTYAVGFGGGYTVTCPIAAGGTSGGTVLTGSATGADDTDFTPAFGNCKFLGFPATILQLGAWNIKATSGPDSSGFYYGDVTIASSTTSTIHVPIAGCSVTVTGHQVFQHGVNGNVIRVKNWTSGTGIDLEATLNGMFYTAVGCPFASGSNGVSTTGGATRVPGVTIS